ncbi:MAG: hypothetical protein UY56_C0005G0053 [Parcubacteria group bacterium GW2011_GWA1_50_14]|uniref:Uncharacterized protein n=1 Tax=Candidatus Liptonbacteria bacterium GWB1_49_6 TaxID=1798644 RepID=A0A1G2C771_9BACT|nr:MAG: hypothetical protein UY56_C0005G0053 [Parcubacteria group bacterium GW2011_GWA1_50_14]OGY96490.1 MAG: hypothetical protein A2122_02220 [Candidatus Liptonbacteria bacterium GWB1_49_6]
MPKLLSATDYENSPTGVNVLDARAEELIRLKKRKPRRSFPLAVRTPNAVTQVSVQKVIRVDREREEVVLRVVVPLKWIRLQLP